MVRIGTKALVLGVQRDDDEHSLDQHTLLCIVNQETGESYIAMLDGTVRCTLSSLLTRVCQRQASFV